MNQRRWLFFFYYLVFAAAICVFFGRPDWVSYYRLAFQGVEAQGRVTSLSCSSKVQLGYTFNVDGKNYEGRGDGGFGNPPCTMLKPGDTIQVSYLPSEPEATLPGNPRERLATETVAIAMAALFVPLVLLVFLFVALRAFRGSRKPPL